MKKLIAILAVTLAMPNMGYAGGEGRYQMLKISTSAVWILDTKTGMLRICGQSYINNDSDNSFDLTEAPKCMLKVDTSK